MCSIIRLKIGFWETAIIYNAMSNKDFHVLSNAELIAIFMYCIIGIIIPIMLFSWLAKRDAVVEGCKKGILAKIMPWLLLCVLIAQFAAFVFGCVHYPWSIEAKPSQASMYREIRYNNSGELIFGWANDNQRPLLASYANCILLLCWIIYAFKFKPSDTSWWKKTCKIIAYIILSAIIGGFSLHGYRDFAVYAIIFAIIGVLLWAARVKPKEKKTAVLVSEGNGSSEKEEKRKFTTQSEDLTRFMPPAMREAVLAKQSENAVDVELGASSEQVVNQSVESMSEDSDDVPVALNQTIAIIAEDDRHAKTNYFYCKHCGKRIELDSAFCKYCGGKL